MTTNHVTYPPHVSMNSIESARIVIPSLLRYSRPRSVVDLGCKHGEWLSVFREHGVERLLGFDQAKRESRVIIDRSEFRTADLRSSLSLPERFDLAVCIEVAEHLPPDSADPLIETLTTLAPVVMFSGAVQHQGGHGHLNEQPREYWKEKFAARGFHCLDCLRPHIWQNPRVAWWYRQNLFLYANDRALDTHPALLAESRREVADDVDLYHQAVAKRQSLAFRLRESLSQLRRRAS